MSAPPVLLVHGFATSCERTWRDNGWIDLLQDMGREVIGVDLLGHGTADKPHDPAAYQQLEALVLEQLPAEPVDAIAFSLGARVTLTLAAQDTTRFRRIVVAGVGANLFRQDPHDAIVAAIEGGGSGDGRSGDPSDDDSGDNPVARYFAGLAHQPDADPVALAALMKSPRPPLDAETLANVKAPVLVVLGDRDFAGPADPLLDALPDASLAALPGTDHFATPKDFRFIDAALKFLE